MDIENLNELYFDYELGETVVVKNAEEISKDLLKIILERLIKRKAKDKDFEFPFGKKLVVYSRDYFDILGADSGSYTYILVDDEGNIFSGIPQSVLYPCDEEESN